MKNSSFDRGELLSAAATLQTEMETSNCHNSRAESMYFQWYVHIFDVSSVIPDVYTEVN